jgi:amino acid transporter
MVPVMRRRAVRRNLCGRARAGVRLDQAQHAVTPHARDHGLVRGIGPLVMAAAIVNGVVGAGIFTLPAAMALEAGAAAPWAYVVCAVAMAAVVTCFAEAGSRVPTSGGAYGTVEVAFGPGTAFVVGILLIFSAMLASGGVAAALADMVIGSVPALAGPAGRAGLIVLILGGLAALNLAGVKIAARVIGGATAFKLLPLLLFVGLGVVFFHHAAPVSTAAGQPGGFGRAVILALFAFCGMETPLGASGEVHAPNRTLPRALFAAMSFVLVLYLAIQFTAQRFLGADLAHAAAPLADAAGRVSPGARAILLAGAGISMLAWMASDVLGSSRMLFALGRDGKLPGFLGLVNPRSRVPANAVLVYVAIAAGLALSGSFLTLIVASALDAAAIYGLACAAAFVLHRRRVALAGPALNIGALPAIAVLGVASMVALVCVAERAQILGLAATMGLAAGFYALAARRAAG